MSESRFSLDELYKMTNHIYSEQNALRPVSATFAHFVEVCGLLTIHARKKKREEVSFEDALCKALGWYFPLLAKLKVGSVEELIFRKFPYACPYCRETPHIDKKCKTVRGTKLTVDHTALKQKYRENRSQRPSGLGEWQEMFNQIYPRNLEDNSRSVVGLFEEIGELAEAVRVFDRFPKYFAGEAADVFSYIMGLANEHSLQLAMQDDAHVQFDFEAEYLKRFPGLCVQCGYPTCKCPMVPDSTVGRMAKELDLADEDGLFITSFENFRPESIQIADRALQRIGGYEGLAQRFPFDRGEANHAVVLFCLKAAEQVNDPAVAASLGSVAIRVSNAATYAGSPKRPQALEEIITPILNIIQGNPELISTLLENRDGSFSGNVGQIIIHELNLGDKYVSSIDPRYVSAWEHLKSTVDLSQVERELSEMRQKMDALPQDTPHDKANQLIQQAEEAAKQRKGPKMLALLSSAGDVSKEVFIKVSSEVISNLVKTAAGIKP